MRGHSRTPLVLHGVMRREHAAVKKTAEALHLQRLQEFLSVLVKLRLRIDSSAARSIIQRQGRGPLKHIETRLLWLQATHDERVKEPTQTNAADGFTKAVQTAKYLEWRNRLGMAHDNGDEAETSKREQLAETGRWERVEALARGPTLGADRNTGAAIVWDEKAWMERLELSKKSLSALRVQPQLTVGRCSVARERRHLGAVHAKTTCRPLVEILLMTPSDQFSVLSVLRHCVTAAS